MTFDYLADLNKAQREAVEHGFANGSFKDAGPLLVIAGAGSGKTKTLAHRVAHLIVNSADPNRILLLTFTRRAAEEIIAASGTSQHQRWGRTTRICPGQALFMPLERACCGNMPPQSA